MKKQTAPWILILSSLVFVPAASSQDRTQPTKTGAQANASPNADTRKMNIQEYTELLRSDVRQQKAEMMGAVMQLSAADAAKFWPIYSEYDAELTKVNDIRVANIQEYARSYTDMTDEKADQIIQNALAYEKQRSDLIVKCYDRVKQALGAITASRFVQVEHQLLLIIDLQAVSSLPIVRHVVN
jgi:hypothetical protein